MIDPGPDPDEARAHALLAIGGALTVLFVGLVIWLQLAS